jgi:2-polyprenyl-6-methoxyphenol hydroxylase-like FAD-dependent oxidoreductase
MRMRVTVPHADLIVIGGGMAGLAVALFCARRHRKVIVIESDAPPPGETPEDDCLWSRPGIPQRWHGHLFLARSSQILTEEEPEFFSDVIARGALLMPPLGDPGYSPVLARRSVYEAVLRRAAERRSGISFLSGRAVTALRGSESGPPAVTGVRTTTGEDFIAELVIDATGRGSRAPRWLAERGARRPIETSSPCRFTYVTRRYRTKDGQAFPAFELPLVAALPYADVVVFPEDNRVFAISMVIASNDPLRKRLMDGEVFDRFAAAVALTARWIAIGVPIDQPHAMGGFVNRWRSLIHNDGPSARGFLLLGDAAFTTSPTLGRGVSLAFAQARRVADALETQSPGSAEFTAAHEVWARNNIGIWLDSQIAEDSARDARISADGVASEDDFRVGQTARLIATLGELRKRDPVVRSVADQAFNLLIEPRDMLRNREVLHRINAYIAERRMPDDSIAGPTRAEFERILTG